MDDKTLDSLLKEHVVKESAKNLNARIIAASKKPKPSWIQGTIEEAATILFMKPALAYTIILLFGLMIGANAPLESPYQEADISEFYMDEGTFL